MKQKVSFVLRLTIDLKIWKTGRFLHTLHVFLENEEQTNEKIYRVMFFCSVENDMKKFQALLQKKDT